MRYTPVCPLIVPLFWFLSFFWVFPIKSERNNTHASRRERGEDREGVGVERERRREGEKGNSWSDGKESDSYRKAINEYGRLRVSIPTESFFSLSLQQVARPPCGKECRWDLEEGIRQWVDVKCWGASELKPRDGRAVPGARRAPGAGCNITSHTQPPR